MGATRETRRLDIAVGIPAYNRSSNLTELLESISKQTVAPAEVTICEDHSPERESIREIVRQWRGGFEAAGGRVNYIENEVNLGYDGNIRKLVSSSHAKWLMLMGNDDLLLGNCMEDLEAYLNRSRWTPMISRSFVRFDTNIRRPLGISRISDEDTIFRYGETPAGMLFRASGFVGGLILDRNWADELATAQYDGSLYYQVYLAAAAFCTEGIGYVGKPIVGGRGNAKPLFGSAPNERDVHIPGSYTPKGRAKMWRAVLCIAEDASSRYAVDIVEEIRSELEVRQSFHVFEMSVAQGRAAVEELRDQLSDLGLFHHPIPRILYWINLIFGRNARFFYTLARHAMQ